MHLFYLILQNSFDANFILSLHSEIFWFAVKAFGNTDMLIPTVAALLGASLSMGLNFAFGYYASRWREDWFQFNEKRYERVSFIFRRYISFLLLLQFLPLMGVFALIAGLFRLPPWQALTFIILGRVAYYGYYLLY